MGELFLTGFGGITENAGGGSGVDVIQYTVGGAYDLADWTATPNARLTFGTGSPPYAAHTAITTVVAQVGTPTEWEYANNVEPRWTSPTIPVAPGDHVRVALRMAWERTANSLSAPAETTPSLLADTLYDESGGAIRIGSFIYAMDGDDYIAGPYTDAANTWAQAWLMDNDGMMVTNEIVILDPATTEIQVQTIAGPIWSSTAGIITLSLARFEITPA
jgi:hypothetical protein